MRVLDRSIERIAVKYGMTDEQFELLDRLVLRPLKNRGAEVFLFGSRSIGKHHSHSDVDLLYRVPGAALPAGFMSEIAESIEESRFPFAVELVEERDLAESYRVTVKSQMKRL